MVANWEDDPSCLSILIRNKDRLKMDTIQNGGVKFAYLHAHTFLGFAFENLSNTLAV